MSVCAVILAGLQGKYAFYAAMPVALTFGEKFNNFLLLYSVDVRIYTNHKTFSLRAAFSPTNKLGLHYLVITVQLKLPLRPHLKATTSSTTTKQKKSSNPDGQKFVADCQHLHPSHKSWCCCSDWVYLTGYVNFLVFSGVGFGAYCAVDFALVMDVLPNDREKAKDLAVWHQVSE